MGHAEALGWWKQGMDVGAQEEATVVIQARGDGGGQ